MRQVDTLAFRNPVFQGEGRRAVIEPGCVAAVSGRYSGGDGAQCHFVHIIIAFCCYRGCFFPFFAQIAPDNEGVGAVFQVGIPAGDAVAAQGGTGQQVAFFIE